MDDQEKDLERQRAQRHAADDPARTGGAPGRSTLTSRMPASASSIARSVVTQLKAAGSAPAPPDIHTLAEQGTRGGGGAVPHADAIQRSFGHHDISGVRAHVGGAAAEAAQAMGARAYASGDRVAFASAPDLHLAAHEVAHVVQQRGGVRLAGGVGAAGDVYERHADAVADLVVQGKSAQSLLDTMAHRGSGGGAAVQHAVQLDVELRDPTLAAAQLHMALSRATSEEAELIQTAIETAAHTRAPAVAVPGTSPSVRVQFEMRGEQFRLWIPRAELPTFQAAAWRGERTGTSDRTCEESPTAIPHVLSRVRVTEPGVAISNMIAGSIAAVAGAERTEQELVVDLNLPAGATGGVISAVIRLRVAHEAAHGPEAAGFLVNGRFEVGAGVVVPGPEDVRARVLAGIEVNARGRDPRHAAQMICFSLEHALHALAPGFSDQIFGGGADLAMRSGMEEGDSAEASGGVRGELSFGGVEHDEGAQAGLSMGLSEHAVVAHGEHGATESTYTSFDLQTSLRIGPFTTSLEAHLPVQPGTVAPVIIARFLGHVPVEGLNQIIAPAIVECSTIIASAAQTNPEAHAAWTRSEGGFAAAAAVSESVQQALLAVVPEGEAGIEVECRFGSGPPLWILRLVQTNEADIGGQHVEYENMHEITRGTASGGRGRETPAPSPHHTDGTSTPALSGADAYSE